MTSPDRIRYLLITLSCLILSACANMETARGNRVMTQADYNAALPPDVDPESRGRLPVVSRDALSADGKAAYDRYMSPDSTSLAGIQGPGGLRLHEDADKDPSLIDAGTRELIRLVIAREMDQQFEWTLHEPVALEAGVDPAIIDIIRYRRPLRGVPEKEAALIQAGREIFREHRVSAGTYARLGEHFGRGDLIEIANLMGGGVSSFILLFMFDVHLPHDREPLLPMP